jgi:hypothetical protein
MFNSLDSVDIARALVTALNTATRLMEAQARHQEEINRKMGLR